MKNHHRYAHANTKIYSGSVLPTPTSTTQPQLGFPLYPLGIQPVWFYKLTTPTCCFDGSQRTFTHAVLQAHRTNLLFYRRTTNLSGFTRSPLKLVVFKANNEPLSTLGWGPTFLKVEFELTNSRTKNNPKMGRYNKFSTNTNIQMNVKEWFEVPPFRRDLRRWALIRWRLFALTSMSGALQSSWSEAWLM